MIRRSSHIHLGMDHTGHRHIRLRDPSEMRRARERRQLHPVIILAAGGGTQPRWRNGMQRRRWLLLTEESRGDRRCFLMTLSRRPLVPPIAIL
jgi:hypothetical protein